MECMRAYMGTLHISGETAVCRPPPLLTWGSMHSGQRRPWSIAMPFSVLNSSLGRPQMFHCRILTASPSTDSSRKLGLQGTPRDWHSPTHLLMASALRYEQGSEVCGAGRLT